MVRATMPPGGRSFAHPAMYQPLRRNAMSASIKVVKRCGYGMPDQPLRKPLLDVEWGVCHSAFTVWIDCRTAKKGGDHGEMRAQPFCGSAGAGRRWIFGDGGGQAWILQRPDCDG